MISLALRIDASGSKEAASPQCCFLGKSALLFERILAKFLLCISIINQYELKYETLFKLHV
jgi:hypothetical protein